MRVIRHSHFSYPFLYHTEITDITEIFYFINIARHENSKIIFEHGLRGFTRIILTKTLKTLLQVGTVVLDVSTVR